MTKEQLKAKENKLNKEIDLAFNKLDEAECVLNRAKEITNAIKYADTAHIIISKLSTLADENGIDESEQDYYLDDIREKMQELQKACYNAEDIFGDVVSDLDCKHDDLNSDLHELQYMETKEDKETTALNGMFGMNVLGELDNLIQEVK